jgi:hypothetical protein
MQLSVSSRQQPEVISVVPLKKKLVLPTQTVFFDHFVEEMVMADLCLVNHSQLRYNKYLPIITLYYNSTWSIIVFLDLGL